MTTRSTNTYVTNRSCPSKIAANKILDYDLSGRDISNTDVGVFSIGNELIILSLISLLYLFSAIEEADWNVFSANQDESEYFVDDTVWNISQFVDKIYSQKIIKNIHNK